MKLSNLLINEENIKLFVGKVEEFLMKNLVSQGEEGKFKVKTLDIKPAKTTMVFSLKAPLFLHGIEIEIENEKDYSVEELIHKDILEKVSEILDKDPLFTTVLEILEISKVEYKRKYCILKDKGPCILLKVGENKILIQNSANFENKKEMFEYLKKEFKIPGLEVNIDACVVFNEEFTVKKVSRRFVQLKSKISENILLNNKISFETMKEFTNEYFENSQELKTLANRKKVYFRLGSLIEEESLPNEIKNLKKINNLKKIFNQAKTDKFDAITTDMVNKKLENYSNPFILERNDLRKFSTNILSAAKPEYIEKLKPYFEKVNNYNKNIFGELDKKLGIIFEKIGYGCIVSYVDYVNNKILLKYGKKNSLDMKAREIDLKDYKQGLSEILSDILKKSA